MTNGQYSLQFTPLAAFGIQVTLIFSSFTKGGKKATEAT